MIGLLIYLIGCVVSWGLFNGSLRESFYEYGDRNVVDAGGSYPVAFMEALFFILCSWVGVFGTLFFWGWVHGNPIGFRLDYRWVIVLFLFGSSPEISGQITLDKISYTIPIDTSKDVTGYTTSDGFNFYILKEDVGDACIQCLGKQPDLLLRSQTLSSLEELKRQLISAEKLKEYNHTKELNHCLTQRNEAVFQYKQEQLITEDLNTKLSHYKKLYRKERTKRWFGIVGSAVTAAGLTYILMR